MKPDRIANDVSEPIYVARRHPIVRLVFSLAGCWAIASLTNQWIAVPTPQRTSGVVTWAFLVVALGISVLHIVFASVTFSLTLS